METGLTLGTGFVEDHIDDFNGFIKRKVGESYCIEAEKN